MTSRCLIKDVVFDRSGNAVQGAKVYIFANDGSLVLGTEPTPPTGNSITGQFYTVETGGSPAANPITTDVNGKWEAWLANPQRVKVAWSDNNHTAIQAGTSPAVTVTFDQDSDVYDAQVAPEDVNSDTTVNLVPAGYDYAILYDGTNTTAYLGADGSAVFGGAGDLGAVDGASFAAVWNACVAVLAARSPRGGKITYRRIGTNGSIPYTATLNTCDGIDIVGPGFSKLSEDGSPLSGNSPLVATATFTSSQDLIPLDGKVGIDFYSRPRATGCTATFSGGLATITTPNNLSTYGSDGINANDKVSLGSFTVTAYNTVGSEGSAVDITVTGAKTFTFPISGSPANDASGTGIVYTEGFRRDIRMVGCSFHANNVLDTNAVIRGKGLGSTSLITQNIFQGGKYNVVQCGSRVDDGSNWDVEFTHNFCSWPDGSSAQAIMSFYVGDVWGVNNCNFAVRTGAVAAVYVHCTDGGHVRIGPGNHIGGGNGGTDVLWASGQNGWLEGNYLDNINHVVSSTVPGGDHVGGGVVVAPHGGSCNGLVIQNNYFHVTSSGNVPWVTFDGDTYTNNCNYAVIRFNSSNQIPSEVVKFVGWTASKQVDIYGNHCAGGGDGAGSGSSGHLLTPLSTGDPAGQLGMRHTNVITGNSTGSGAGTPTGGNDQDAQGTATFTGGATTLNVNHTCYGVPTRIHVTPQTKLIDNSGNPVGFWVSGGTGTLFVINLTAVTKVSAGGANATPVFHWKASVI